MDQFRIFPRALVTDCYHVSRQLLISTILQYLYVRGAITVTTTEQNY